MELPKTGEFAHIGKSVAIKGELSGSADLYIDGQVEGSLELQGSSLTVGHNGQVHANVNANVVLVHGKVDGTWHKYRHETLSWFNESRSESRCHQGPPSQPPLQWSGGTGQIVELRSIFVRARSGLHVSVQYPLFHRART